MSLYHYAMAAVPKSTTLLSPDDIPQELMSDFFPYDWRMDVPK
jgi:hypothetical protein